MLSHILTLSFSLSNILTHLCSLLHVWTPLCSLQAQPLKPRRERPEKSEEWHRRSAKLRELEEELLGGGGSSQTAGSEPENVGGDVEKTEDGEEEDYGERGTRVGGLSLIHI